MKLKNLYKNLEYDANKEIVTTLFIDEKVEIIRITSMNQTTNWLSDSRKELAILLEGEALIEFEDKKVELKKGDSILIDPLVNHKVYNTSKTSLWLCYLFNNN